MPESERIATNLRLLLIVEALAKAGQPLTPTQINERIGLPKQTMHRLCHSLVDHGFLERSGEPARLAPGARLRALSAGLLTTAATDIARHQILQGIASRVREAVNFVVPERGGMIYLDRVDTDWPLRVQLAVGTHVPFHCTASGKSYLASLSHRHRIGLLRALDLRPMARNTLTTVESLLEETDIIAERGYAIDNEEFMDGLVALAVPVTNDDGRFIAAVAFHGPTQRLDSSQALSHLSLLRDGAARLAELLDPRLT